MGWFSQLGLLLKKNVIQRLRHPVLLIFEVIWPIAIFLAVAIVRQGAGPQQKQECVYNARAMPSAGLVPFIQTFVCNINNQCKNRTDQVVAGATVGARIGKVIDKLEPVLMSKNTKNVLKNLPENVKTIQAINKVLEKKEVQDFIDANMTLGRFFTDPNAVEKFLVSDLRVMKRDVVRSLMAATVNMSKVMELMDTLRFREIVCKPALLASYLVFPEKTNVTLISQELCNINDTLIPSITKTIQMQINIAEIIRLASELSNVFGNYTLTSQLNDVATMVDLLMKYTPLKVVLQQFPELSLLSQWLTNIFAIVTDYKPSEKLDLTLLGNVLDDLDPLIVKWTNNSQEWQDIKKTFYYASQLVTWLTQGIDSLPRMRLTFGMLFPNTTSIKEYITKSSQVTPEVVEALLGATIDRAKLQALIGKAQATNSSLKQLLCDGDHYSQVITLPPTANIVLMKRVQSSLCAFNFSVLSQEINDAFKIDTIVKQLAEFDRSQIGQQSLNWTTVINTGQKLMASVSRLLQSYIGDIGRVLKDLDLRAVWHSLGGLVLPGNNTAEESLKVLQQTLINSLQSLQSVLEQQSDWPVTRRVFIVVDLSLDVLEASTNYASDLHRYFSIFLHNSTILQDMLGALSDMGPRTAASIISALTEPSNVQKILQDPSHLSRIFCDQALVGVFFKLPPGVNTKDVKHHMCNLDLTALTNEIQKLSNMTQLITAVENLMRVSEAGFLDKSELVSRADLKTIAQRTSDVISKLVHVVTSYVDSSKSVVWPEVNIKWNATIWQQVWEDITKQQTNALMSNLITGVGPVLENSTLWTTVGPYVKSLNAVLEHINRQVLSQAPSPILDQLIKYLKDYGIDFIKALTQLVQSPAKTKELFALTRDFKLLCDPVNFQRLFQLPPSVPVSDVLQFACNLNASVIVNEILTVYDTSIVTAEIVRYFNHSLPDGTARDFDWDRLVHTLNQLQFKAPLMLTKNPFSLFATLISDYTKISSAVDGLFTAMQNMSWNGFESVALFSIEQLGNLDAMLVNDSTWRMMKYGINVVDVIVQGMTKQMKSMSDGTFKLEDMFANATVMKDFLQSTADMAPDMMEVIMKTALDPSKMVITMLKIDWSKKTICNGVSFTDLMDFPDTEAVTEFERQLCKMNADYLSEQLQNSPMQKPMTEAIEVFFKPWAETNPMPDIQLDWKAIDQNMREMFEVMMKPMNATGMMNNLPQVNLTAFEVKMNSSVDLFLNYDWSGVNVAGFQDLYNLVDNMTLNGSDDVWKLMWNSWKLSAAMNAAFIKMASQQMIKLNGATVTVTDLLPSNELKKAFRAVEESPMITEMLLNTVLTLVSDPTKLTYWSNPANLANLCVNQTVFEALFTPPNAGADMKAVMEVVCGANINVTILVQELTQNLDGLTEIISLVASEKTGNSIYQLNVTELFLGAQSYANSLTSVIQNPPTVVLPNDDWLNGTVWTDLWLRFEENSGKLGMSNISSGNIASFLPFLEGMLSQLAVDPAARVVLSKVSDVLQIISFMFNDAQKSVSGDPFAIYRGTVEAAKILDVLNNAPDLMEILLNTMLSYEKANALIQLLAANASAVCMDPSRITPYVVYGENTRVNVTSLVHMFCTMDYDVLLKELSQPYSRSTAVFARLLAVPYNENYNSSTFVSNLQRAISSITGASQAFTRLFLASVNNTTPIAPRWMDEHVWKTTFGRVAERLQQQQVNLTQVDYAGIVMSAMRPLLSMLGPSEQQVFARIADSYLFTVELMKMMQATPSEVRSMFNDTVELKKLIGMLDNLPGYVEDLLYVASDPVKMNGFIISLISGENWCEAGMKQNSKAITYICTQVNFTVLEQEVMSHQGDLLAPLQRMVSPSHKYTFSVDGFLHSYMSLQKQTENLINYLVKVSQGAVNSTSILPWLDDQKWSAMFDRLTKHIVFQYIGTNQPDYTRMIITSMKPTLSTLAQLPGAQYALARISDGYLFATELMKLMQASPSEAHSMFNDTVELRKLIGMLDNLPIYVEDLLYMATDPVKMNGFIISLISGENWCEAGMKQNSRVITYICTHINFTVLEQEVMSHQGDLLAPLQRMLTPGYNYTTFSVDSFLHSYMSLQKQTENLINYLVKVSQGGVNSTSILPWLDGQRWSAMFNRFTKHIISQNNGTTQPDYTRMIINSMKPTLTTLAQLPGAQYALARISDGYLFATELMKLMQATPAEAHSMFNDTMELKKLIGMLDNLPVYVEDLLYMATDPVKMNGFIISLISGENWCEAGMKQNSRIIRYLCTHINFTVLEQEVMSHQGDLLAPLQRMLTPGYNYTTFSVDSFLHSYMSLQKQTENLINYLVKVSQGGVNSTSILPWLDGQRWSAMFDRFTKHIISQNNGTTQPDYTRMIINSMKPTLTTLAQLPGAQYALARISDGYLFATELMKLMQATPAEAHSMFNDTMELKKLIGMLDNLPVYVEDLLYMATDPVKMNGFIISLISGENWCEAGMKQNSRVIRYLCTHINFTVLEQEVMSHQGDLLAPLQRMLTPGYNYTTFSVDSFLHSYMSLQKQTENLINYLVKVSQGGVNSTSILPWLDGQRWSAMFDRFTKHIISQNNGTTQPDYTRMIITSMKPTLTTLAQLPGVQPVLARISDGYLFAIELMKLMQATPSDVHSMFNDTVELRKLIGMLDNLPSYVEDLLYMATDPVKMNGFIISLISGENWCEAGMKQNSRVITYICTHINFTVLEQEVMSHQGDFLAPLQRMVTPGYNYTAFSIDSLLHSYMSLQKQTENLINYLVKVSLGGVNSTSILPWLDGQKWSAMFDRFTKHIISQNNGTNQPDYTQMIITSMKPTLTTLAQLPGVQPVLARISDGYLFAIELMKLMQATPSEVHSMFNDTVELRKLVGMLDNLPSYVEDLLYMASDPVKLNGFIQSLLNGATWCEAGMRQNSSSITYICTHINFTVLEQEAMSHQGDLLAPLQRMLSPHHNYTFSIDSFLQTIMTLQKQTESLINYLVKVSQGGVNGTSIQLWLDRQKWSAMFDRFTRHIIMEYNRTSSAGLNKMIMEAVKNSITPLVNITEVNNVLFQMNGMVKFLNVAIDMVKDPRDPLKMFDYTVEFKKLIDLLDQSPEIVEALLYTLTDPLKLMKFIDAAATNQLCNSSTTEDYVTRVPGSSLDTNAVKQTLCTVNYTAIPLELMNDPTGLKLIEHIQGLWDPSVVKKVNLDMFLSDINTLITTVTHLSSGGITTISFNMTTPRWLNETRWAAIFGQFWTQLQDRMNVTANGENLLVWLHVLENTWLKNQPGYQQFNGAMNTMSAILDVVLEKLSAINGSYAQLTDLVQSSPQMVKLLEMINKSPDIVQILMYSLSTEKFLPLYQRTNVTQLLVEMCVPTKLSPPYPVPHINIKDYLTLPPGSNINIDELLAQFCNVDFAVLVSEAMTEFDIQNIRTQINNPAPTNWTVITQQITQLSAIITGWVKNPPNFPLDHRWMNATIWLDILSRYAASQNNPQEIVMNLGKVLYMLEPLFANNTDVQRLLYVVDTLQQVVTQHLKMYPGQNLTLASLLSDTPQLLTYIRQSLALGADVQEVLLHAVIKRPAELSKLAAMPNPWYTLCEAVPTYDIATVFVLPDHVNASAVRDLICKTNMTAISMELMNKLGLASVIAKLSSGQEVRTDLRQVLTNSQELYGAISALITNPPTFVTSSLEINITAYEHVYKRFLEAVNFTNAEYYRDMIANLEITLRNIPGAWEAVKGQLLPAKIMVDYMTSLLSRIQPQEGVINLASLFRNPNRVVDIMNMAFNLGPDFVNAIMSTYLKPIKVVEFALLKPSEMQAVMCSEERMSYYIQFHSSFNVSYAVKALCGLNATKMVEQLSSEFNINSLLAQLTNLNQSFSLQSYLDSYNTYSGLLTQLFMATDVYFKDTDLAQLFNYTPPADQSNLLAFVQNLPQASVESLASMLQQLMPMVEQMDWWKEVRPHLDVLNILVDTINNKLDAIAPYRLNMTLESVLPNSRQLRRFIERNFGLAPELVQAVMYARIDSTKLGKVKSPTDLFCTDVLSYPWFTNETAIKEVLCNVNYMALWEEIKVQLNYEAIVNQLSRARTNATLPPFNWTTTLANMRDLAIDLGALFTNFTVPPLDKFFGYEGNFTAWIIKMETAYLQPSMTLEDLPKVLAGTLDSLSPLLESSITGRSLLAMYKQYSLMLDIVHRRLKDLQGSTISLDSLLVNATHVKSLLKATLGVSPSVVETLLLSQPRLDKLTVLLSAKDPFALLCNSSFSFVELPPNADMNVTQLYRALCSVNVTIIVKELMAQLDIHRFMEEMSRINSLVPQLNKSMSVDWSTAIQSVMDINKIIAEMVTKPPPIDPALIELFNFDKYLPALQKFIAHYQKTLQTNMDLNELAKIFDSLTPLLKSTSFGKDMLKSLQIANLILENVNYRIDKFSNSPVSLQTLLGNGTRLSHFLETSLKLAPEVISALLQANIKPSKMRELIQLPSNESVKALCGSPISDYFELPAGSTVSVDQFKLALCSIDVNVFVAELAKEYRQDVLDREIAELFKPNATVNFNMTALLSNLQGVISLSSPSTFANLTVSQHLIDLFNMTRFEPVIQALAKNDPMRLMDTLLLVAQMFEGTGQWNASGVNLMFNSLSVQIKLMNVQMKMLTDLGYNVENVLTNMTAVRELMDRLMQENYESMPKALRPTYEAMLMDIMRNRPAAVRRLFCNETALRSVLSLPLYVNASAMSMVLCTATPDNVWDSFIKAGLNTGELVGMTTKLIYYTRYYPTTLSPVRWQELKQNLRSMVDVIDKLSKLPPNVISGFNATYWQPIMETLVDSVARNSFTGVLRTMQLLDPLLRDQQFWKEIQSYVQLGGVYMQWLADQLEKLEAAGGQLKLVNLMPDVDKVTTLLRSAIGPQAAAEFLTVVIQPNAVLRLIQTKEWPDVFCNRTAFASIFKFPAGVDVVSLQIQLCQSVKNGSLVVDQLMGLINVQRVVKEMERLTKKPSTNTMTQDPFKFFLKQAQRLMLSVELIQKLGNISLGGFEDYLRPITATLTVILDPSANNIGGMCDSVVSLIDETVAYPYIKMSMLTSQTTIEIMEDILKFIPDVDDLMCDLSSLDLIGILQRFLNKDVIDVVYKFEKLITQNFTSDDFKCSAYIGKQMALNDLFNFTIYSMPSIGVATEKCAMQLLTGDFKMLEDFSFYIKLMNELQNFISNDTMGVLSQLTELKPIMDMIISGITSQTAYIGDLRELFTNASDIQQILSKVADLTPRMVDSFLQSTIKLNAQQFFNQTVEEIAAALCSPRQLEESFNISPLLGLTSEQLSKRLCGPNVTQLAASMKSAVNVAQLAAVVSQSSNGTFNIQWLIGITDDLKDILKYTGSLIKLQSAMPAEGGINIEQLLKILPSIEDFITNKGPDALFESMYSLIGKLAAVATTPESKEFLQNLESLTRGIRGLNVFKNLFPTVAVKDLVKDPQSLHKYMVDKVKLPPRTAAAVLNATFKYTMFLGQNMSSINLTDLFCNKSSLSVLLNFDPSVDVGVVSRALCSLNTSMITAVTSELLPKMDIGNLIKEYFQKVAADGSLYSMMLMPDEVMTFDPNKLLGSSNVSMNVSQLKETVEQLKPVSTKLSSALQEVKNFTNSGNVPNVSTLIDPITGKFQAQVGLRTVSSMLCGSTNAFELPEVSMFGNSPGSSSSNNDPTSGSSVGSQSPGSQGAGSQSAAAAPTSASADGKTPSNAGTTTASDPRVKYASVMKFFPKDAQEDFFSLPSDFCRDLYMQMTDSDTASVIWHYLKPLLRGTILFSPDTPAVRRIIKMANSTFFEISRLQEFARTVLAGSDGLSQLMNQDFSKLENALKNSFVSTAIQQMTGVKSQDLLNSLTNFGGMSPDDFKNIQRLAELVVDFLDCVNMDVFQPVATSEEANKEAVKLAAKGKFIASVEFLNMDQRRSRRDAESSDGIPKHVQYKIRTSTDNSPPTERIKDLLWVPGPEDSFAFDLSYLRGFVQLQEMIDRAIIKLHARDNVTLPVTYLQQEPYPCYEKDSFVHWFRFVIPIMMTLAFIFVIANAVRLAVYDKQTGMDETLKIMGLNASTDWLAWFLNIFLGMVVMSIILVIILKVSGILRYSDPIILGLFFICFSFSTLMLCYLISVFFNRTNLAALTGIIVYLTMYLPYVFVTVLDQQLLFWENMIVCLFSTSAFSLGCAYVTRYEEQGIGIQFSNIDRSPMAGDDLTLSWCCIMMVIDAAIYGVIAWYIRHVFPGKLGMPQPWYFFLTPRYWGCCLGSSHKYKARRSSSNVENGADCVVEPLITGLPVGIGIDSMTKKYKKNKLPAIDNLNLDFFEGQVSALLGENGAGKTTTIKTLIGMFPPTKGTAYINDLDVRTDFLKIRRDLGYCPQQDTLFEDMTVQEHLMFFAQLKTDSAAYKVKHDVHRMLRKIDLNKVRNELVANLSGGQRRRLAVAIAFIGDSKVIILDEPTSGVDPAARRKIWDIITKHREDRTVVLCTHHLDEAELIGDRIAILNKGKLVCNGSPMFLRAKFGDGYQLTISKKQEVTSENSDAADCTSENAVTEFIASRMPGAHLISSLGSQLIYVLPREQQGIYHRFFQELDHHKDELNIGNYGVSDSSLESIYLKVCKESLRRGSENPGFRDFNQEETETHVPSEDVTVSVDTSLPQLNGQRTSGCGLKMQQLGALLAKRFHHHKRYWRGYISTILVPMLLMCLAMGSSLLTPRDKQQPSLQLQTSLYQPSHVYIKNADSSLESKQIKAAFTGPSGLGTTCMPGQNMTWLDWKLKKIEGQCKIVTNTGFKEPSLTQADEEKYAKNLQCSCDAVTGRQICPDGAEGRPMPSMKLNSTDFIYDLGGEDVEDWIVKSHQQFLEKRYGGWVLEKSPEEELMMTVYYNNKGHHAITAFLNAMSNSLLRSMINTSDVDSNEYGITTYNHPITFASGMLDMDTLYQRAADTGISVTILCAFCFIPAGFIIYLVAERVKKEKHLQHLAGVGPILYWVSAFIWDLFCCLWPVAISAAIMAGFGLSVYNDRLNLPATVLLLFLFCWATIPFCYLISRMFENTSTAYMMAFCINFFLGLNTTTTMFLLRFFTQKPMVALVYNHLQYILLVFPQYALGGGLIQLATNQLETEMFSRFNLDKYRDPFTMRMLLPNYIALCVSGVVFFVLTLLLEMHCQCRSQVHSDNKYAEDEDVTMERKRVAHSRPGEDTLTISELTKVYRSGLRKVLAVDNITFGVSKGECFGLLGVNGAGKTTTFKMLTSDISASGGNAQLMGKNILSAPSNMGSVVGYCPQVDALDDFLTGKEVLTIYAKMKGITGKDVDVIVSNALSMMELSHCANKMTKNYSGGMKRKLSAAMALIGDPLIVFMDEPTSGMDPVSRRLLWKHVQNVIKDGRSVILTSHSMSECDALCTRLAIMVNGQFKCLGNPQHIKSKYGEGYTVQVRAAAHAMDDVKTFVLNTFPGALIKEQQYNIMEFHTSYSTTSLSAIFGHLESHKKPLQILDYSVAQTTLDQVFVNFANHQSDGTMGGNSAPSSCESTPKAEHQSKSNQSQYASNLTYGTLEHDLPLNVRNGKDTKVAEETEDTYF